MNQDALDEIEGLQAEATEAHAGYLSTRFQRDEAIREAISHGVTMYAIAKRTGLSEQAVAKIRDRA